MFLNICISISIYISVNVYLVTSISDKSPNDSGKEHIEYDMSILYYLSIYLSIYLYIYICIDVYICISAEIRKIAGNILLYSIL